MLPLKLPLMIMQQEKDAKDADKAAEEEGEETKAQKKIPLNRHSHFWKQNLAQHMIEKNPGYIKLSTAIAIWNHETSFYPIYLLLLSTFAMPSLMIFNS